MSKVFITHSQAVFGRRLDPNYHKVQHRIASRASSICAELRRERAAIEDARLVAKRDDFIKSRIFTVRGVQVVLDRDLAELYGVQTKVLNQAVKRNANRFPPEFMFALTDEETEELVTNCDRFRSVRHSSVPMRAFSEHGVIMVACYKKLWKLLIDKDMTKTGLRMASGVSSSTIAKLTRGDDIKVSILVRLCEVLGCDIENKPQMKLQCSHLRNFCVASRTKPVFWR